MSFTYDLATNIGKVRLLIQDTAIKTAQFSDEEVTVFLTMASSVLKTAAVYALESWAAALTGAADSEKIGDYAYTKKQVANKLALAEKYRAEVSGEPILEIAEMDLTGEEE